MIKVAYWYHYHYHLLFNSLSHSEAVNGKEWSNWISLPWWLRFKQFDYMVNQHPTIYYKIHVSCLLVEKDIFICFICGYQLNGWILTIALLRSFNFNPHFFNCVKCNATFFVKVFSSCLHYNVKVAFTLILSFIYSSLLL